MKYTTSSSTNRCLAKKGGEVLNSNNDNSTNQGPFLHHNLVKLKSDNMHYYTCHLPLL